MMEHGKKIVIVGAGVFGLTLAHELALQGYTNILVVDRHMPPVPDGSSNDISRVVRFDYGDDDYCQIAREAYLKWQTQKYDGIFHPAPYILAHNKGLGEAWVSKTTANLTKFDLPWETLPDAKTTKSLYPCLSGSLVQPHFAGYHNRQAGWADAHKAIRQLRDDCIQLGVSFTVGSAGTVTSFETNSSGKITAARTLDGGVIKAECFVLAAGAWASSLVPMYNSTLSTGQVVAYLKLTEPEMRKYKDLPIYMNVTTGWFNFPPYKDENILKMAVHGWGYTRAPEDDEKAVVKAEISTPRIFPKRQRENFVPSDGEARLRQGLVEILPELADRPFDRLALCWYTDTPTGDFIMDYHPEHSNLFVIGGGSGHLFKFLPVLGEYSSKAFSGTLPQNLATKWRFRTEYRDQRDVFKGDGSRGGPERRELSVDERCRL